MYSFARHDHGLAWVTLSAISLFVHGCGSMSADNPAGNGAAAGTESVSPASDTLFSTIETPDFGRYDLVARGPDDGSGEWQFAVRSGRGAPAKNELRFVWDFGDGTTYEGVEQSYSFTTNGSYVIKVKAIKLDGTVAFVLTLNIEVALVINAPPIADAGTDQTADANALVFLYGGASSDPDGDPLTYQWVQISGEPVLLLHANEPTASFIAPSIPQDADLVFGVTVGDGGYNEQDTVVVRVLRLVQPAETVLVTADAGEDQLDVVQGTPVTLDGSGSSSSDGSLTFAWSQMPVPTVVLSAENSDITTFVAPRLDPGTTEEFLFELVVSAGGQSASDQVRVTVTSTSEPVIGGTDPVPPVLTQPSEDELLLFHFDRNAQDASATAAHGTWRGTADYAEIGVLGQAASFSGSSYVEISSTSGLAVTDQLTVAAWVRFDTLPPAAAYSFILDTTVESSPRTGYSVFYRKSDQVICAELWSAGSVVFGIDSGTTAWALNAWNHVAVVFDSSAGLGGGDAGRLYVNGGLVRSPQWGVGPGAGVGPKAAVGRYFVGDLDEVEVWGRALTATEIQQLAQVPSASSVCGNDTIDAGEQCDRANLNNQTCQTQGFTGGTLACRACAFDTSLCTTTPSPGAITAKITPSRTTCMAPCAIFFEGTESTDANGNKIGDSNGGQGLLGNDIVEYTWDFGAESESDTSSGGRYFSAFNAAHVYETPQTYTVKLTVKDKDGRTHSTTQTIQVNAFSGTTICRSNTNAQEDIDACNAVGATLEPPTNDYSRVGSNTRVLYKRGDTFSYTSAQDYNGKSNIIIGAFGNSNEPRPFVQYKGTVEGENGAAIVGSLNEISVMDIQFNGQSTVNGVFAYGVYAWSNTLNLLFLRTAFDQIYSNVFYTDGLFMASSRVNGHSPGIMYYSGSRLAIINSELGPAPERQILYGSAINRGVITGNYFHDTLMVAVRLSAQSGLTINVIVSGNEISNSNKSGVAIGLASQFGVADVYGARNFLIERNYIHNNYSFIDLKRDSYSNIIIRNNIIANNTVSFGISAMTDPAGGATEPVRKLRFYGNTIYSPAVAESAIWINQTDHEDVEIFNNIIYGAASANWVRAIQVDQSVGMNEITSNNNLVYYPNRPDGKLFGVGTAGYTLTEWQTNFGKDQSSLLGDPLLMSSYPVNPSDFKLQSTSPAIDKGANLPLVFEDYEGTRRPRGVGDIGAFEQ